MHIWFRQHRDDIVACGVSALAQVVFLLFLGLIIFRLGDGRTTINSLSENAIDAKIGDNEVVEFSEPIARELNEARNDHAESSEIEIARQLSELMTDVETKVSLNHIPMTQAKVSDATKAKQDPASKNTSVRTSRSRNQQTDDGSERLAAQFAARHADARGAFVEAYGGNAKSEAAVDAGLKWLAAHQSSNGSWSFDHTTAECNGSCGDPGMLHDCRIGATGMALLAFLGSGRTHREGEYQKEVGEAIDFLLDNMKWDADGNGLDLRDGSMPMASFYVQGIVSMALSEAYVMTSDRRLLKPAQGAIDFIVWAQDPRGGGWRYRPQMPGDTSVVGWQAMALTSARVAGLKVPSKTLTQSLQFLKSVETKQGIGYGYTNRVARPSTTAIGFLCRMYLEPNPPRKTFQRGAKLLGNFGPSYDDMYYNYYATQFMHHYGGPEWDKWNASMRDWLIETQETRGHAAGSWSPRDLHSRAGGRLYMTTMAIMTLEVYYRHLPLYQHGTERPELPDIEYELDRLREAEASTDE
ncbi:MAG: terpene cyclase/mutase family protein [Planctomycetota bacterium]|nr:terpene cyclase/mutase family protein [Planctomycetota bacterium]